MLTEDLHRLPRVAEGHLLAMVEHHRELADTLHELGRVRHHDDRPALLLESLDSFQALALERLVPDREYLVDEEDVGVDVDRDPRIPASRTCRRSRTAPAYR